MYRGWGFSGAMSEMPSEIDIQGQTIDGRKSVPAAAWLYGGLGAMPFVLGAGAMVSEQDASGLAAVVLVTCGAVILSFLGGIHWGLAMAAGQTNPIRLGLSVVPSLVGWSGVLVGGETGLMVLAGGFVAMLMADRWAGRRGWSPAWFPELRLPLSLVVVGCLMLTAFKDAGV